MSKNDQKGITNRVVILKGEGSNEHVLVADEILLPSKTKNPDGLHGSCLVVGKNGVLTHVDPTGVPAEHNTIPVEEGTWLIGRQVEYNPFSDSITGVFD